MSVLGRFQLLQRLAQQTAPTTQSGPNTLNGSPAQVDVVTMFPAVIKIWGSNNQAPIQKLVSMVNTAIWVLSAGQTDFNQLRLQGFNIDISKYPDQTLAAIVRLARAIYLQMLNLPADTQPLTPQQKATAVREISQSLNVSAIPDSGINAFLQSRIGGAFKALVNALLPSIR